MSAVQLSLDGDTIPQRFEAWKQRPGARKIMEKAYALAACFYRRFQARGIGVSQRYIEEQLRDWIRLGKLRGENESGYELNSHFTKPMLLHMLHERPEWSPMFELRDRN